MKANRGLWEILQGRRPKDEIYARDTVLTPAGSSRMAALTSIVSAERARGSTPLLKVWYCRDRA